MSSKTTTLAFVICAVLVLGPVFARGQSGDQGADSLADLARKQRSKNGKEGKQPTKVYSNDDFPEPPPKAPSTASATKTSAAGTEKANGDANAKSDSSGPKPHDEKYFRSKMDELRANLASDKVGLVKLQEEMDDHYRDAQAGGFIVSGQGQLATDKVNTNWTTDPIGYHNFWVSEGKRLRSSIDSQKKEIASDEKAISDLIDQCRREDCKPGWIR